MANTMEIGKRIKELRLEKEISMDMFVADVNQRYGLKWNKSMISRWESEQTDPSLECAKFLSMYFDVSLDYLIGLTDIRIPSRLLGRKK